MKRRLEPKFELIERWASGARRVLDVGCNDGSLTSQLGNDTTFRVGFDFPVVLPDRPERSGFHAVGGDASVTPLPFRNASFDTVVASGILDYIPNDLSLLRELHRLLIPGGRLIVIVPNQVSLRRRGRALKGKGDALSGRELTHGAFNVYTRAQLSEYLVAAGFARQIWHRCPTRIGKQWRRIETVMPASMCTNLAVCAERDP